MHQRGQSGFATQLLSSCVDFTTANDVWIWLPSPEFSETWFERAFQSGRVECESHWQTFMRWASKIHQNPLAVQVAKDLIHWNTMIHGWWLALLAQKDAEIEDYSPWSKEEVEETATGLSVHVT